MRSKALLVLLAVSLPVAATAEDFEVIPKVKKGEMKDIKEKFGKSVAESKTAENRMAEDSEEAAKESKERRDNFGAKASAEAKKLREQTDRKGGIGDFAKKNNPGADKRPSDAGAVGVAKAAAAREAAPGGRPSDVGGGKPEGVGSGKPDGVGGGKPGSPGQSGGHGKHP